MSVNTHTRGSKREEREGGKEKGREGGRDGGWEGGRTGEEGRERRYLADAQSRMVGILHVLETRRGNGNYRCNDT